MYYKFSIFVYGKTCKDCINFSLVYIGYGYCSMFNVDKLTNATCDYFNNVI